MYIVYLISGLDTVSQGGHIYLISGLGRVSLGGHIYLISGLGRVSLGGETLRTPDLCLELSTSVLQTSHIRF